MRCGICKQQCDGTKSAVIGSQYYADVCDSCAKSGALQPHDAAFSREREREDSAKEILQPFNPDGSINRDFAYAYPDEATEMFGEDNLKEVET